MSDDNTNQLGFNRTVNASNNFPYADFKSFKHALAESSCVIDVNESIAMDWAAGRWIYPPQKKVAVIDRSLFFLPVMLGAAIVLCSIATSNWLVLSAVPLCVLGIYIFDPVESNKPTILQGAILLVILFGLGSTAFQQDYERCTVFSSIIFCLLLQVLRYKNAITNFKNLIAEDECFCCSAWALDDFTVLVEGSKSYAYKREKIVNTSNAQSILPLVSPEPNLSAVASSNTDSELETSGNLSDAAASHLDNIESLNSSYIKSIEFKAMQIAIAYEMASGRTVRDVSTEYVGYDLSSTMNDESRAIEVKGKATAGSIIITYKEWKTAGLLANDYYLYIVENISRANPKLKVIQNPHATLSPSVYRTQYLLKAYTYKSAALTSIEI